MPGQATLSSVSLSQSSVTGQSQPTGTVTLTASAPAGGAVVSLASSNPGAVQVPATVTVPSGSTSATFRIDTSTVSSEVSSTITASYGGVTRTAPLSVNPPPLAAIYTVTSPVKGTDGCVLGPETDEVDCVLDAKASTGFIDRWIWRYWTVEGSPIGHNTADPQSRPAIGTRCSFFDNARGGDDAQGSRYIQLTIELVVQDKLGNRSAPVRRALRLYPNRLCGFSY
ncbi:MAG: hypothetical protein HOP16_21060 [Acidobacteria bacterium]|nr:hypothetical protein [Acidobacteriota bacterium]